MKAHYSKLPKNQLFLSCDLSQKPNGTRNGKGRDPNLDDPAVKKYREIARLQANHIQRAEIAATVDDRGLRIWEAVLTEHMLHGWNPKDVLRMLKTYELQRYP